MKLYRNDAVEMLQQIDFGDIDGYGDPKLDQYFLDNNYWDRVVNNDQYFIIGRKGTGKSSIYRMIQEQGEKNGVIVENKDFGDFPFERLLNLDDSNFTRPNQYQSIWKNLILNIFAKTISDYPITGDEQNRHHEQISRYARLCIGDLVEMHKEILTKTRKTTAGLEFDFLKANHEIEDIFLLGNGHHNITIINSSLERLVMDYFLTCPENRKIIIQFDRLDDNYNQYQNQENYFNAIISLFKVTYRLNQNFRSRRIDNARIILYLRSDILKEIGKRDAESSRWNDFSLFINWSIINKNDWDHSKLLQMIEKRISVSLHRDDIRFSDIFDTQTIRLTSGKWSSHKYQDVFQYIMDRTMHRPRDLVQFCKCIQKEAIESDDLYFRTIKNAEKDYCHWLINMNWLMR